MTKISLTIYQIYAPTSAADVEITEQFYDEVNETIHEHRSLDNKLIIMGDWNSQFGQREIGENNVSGDYNFGKRNDRGWRLIRFCQEHNLEIMNSFFKKKVYEKWSWVTPNLEHKTLIDYIIIPGENNTISDCEARLIISSNSIPIIIY